MTQRKFKKLLQKEAPPPGLQPTACAYPTTWYLTLSLLPRSPPTLFQTNPLLCHLSQALGFGIWAWDSPRKQKRTRRKGPGAGRVNHTTTNLQDCNMSLEPLPTHSPGSTTSCCCELTAVADSGMARSAWRGAGCCRVHVCV